MQKDFDKWNLLKKNIDLLNNEKYVYSGEVWWCNIGINIGKEIDGKNNNFERPVFILKTINKYTSIVIPISSKKGYSLNNIEMQYTEKNGQNKKIWLKTSQLKTISNKRFIRKVYRFSSQDVENILNFLRYSFF